MAQFNKPATQVTIAPVREKSGLALCVDRYWKLAAVVAVGATGALLYWQYSKQEHQAKQAKGWERIRDVAQEDESGRLIGDATTVAAVAREIKESEAAPWALYVAAGSAVSSGDYATATDLIAELEREHAGSPLARETFPFESSAGPTSPLAALGDRATKWAAWSTARPTTAPVEATPPSDPLSDEPPR